MASAAQSMAPQMSGAAHERLAFRPEIEGLRAVAIVPVLLIHAGFTQVPGGFVGVDVFFVISGYLITRIILVEMEAGPFSLARFYARRLARLGPALWAMLATTLLTGLWLLLPSDWPDLTTQAIWAAGFGANLHFWQTTDYFATHETALLLHTWSLGVEEQFYLFYPLFLIAVHRWFPGRKAMALAILATVSLALALLLSRTAPQAAFYLFSSRAWELALGGLIACRAGVRIDHALARAALALAGLAMIALAVVGIEHLGAFPAPAALLPCVGTALVIAYGTSGPARSALSLGPVRWIGRISYSTYLWHWPIMVFWRLEHGMLLDRWSRVGLVIAALLAGALSYYAIERPGQRALLRLQNRDVFRATIASFAGLVTLAIAGLMLSSQLVTTPAARTAAEMAAIDEAQRIERYRYGTCFGERVRVEECLRPSDGARDVALMGDSYAAMLWRALRDADPQVVIHQVTALGCKPLVGAEGTEWCVDAYQRVFDRARAGEVQKLVLAARWSHADAPALAATIREMAEVGVSVSVIGPPVEYRQSFPRVLAIAERRGDPSYIARMRRSERDAIDPVLRAAVEKAGGRYISHVEFECPDGRCQHFGSDGWPIHYDTGHLTEQAARDFVNQFTPMWSH